MRYLFYPIRIVMHTVKTVFVAVIAFLVVFLGALFFIPKLQTGSTSLDEPEDDFEDVESEEKK